MHIIDLYTTNVNPFLRVNEEDLMCQIITPLRNNCKKLVVNNFPPNLKRAEKSTGFIDLHTYRHFCS